MKTIENIFNKEKSLEKEKKDISKSKDKSLFEKSKKISLEIEKINKLQIIAKDELNLYCHQFQIYLFQMFLLVKMKTQI